MRKIKKVLSIITSIALSIALFAMPVSAAEVIPVEEVDTITTSTDASVYATNCWSRTTTKLYSLNGTSSNVASVSSGSISGTEPQITTVEVYCNVNSGSDPFWLYIEDANGNVYRTLVSKSETVVFSGFNGLNPYGQWKIWIVTDGIISTATITIRVCYTY